MTLRRRRVLLLANVLLVALACVLHAAPASADEYSVDIVSLDESAFPALGAVVNVLDAAGRPVPGLTGDSFQARVGGEPARIDDLRTALDSDVSLAVALVVDVSGSMEGEPLAQARLAAAEFVQGLSPQDSVAVITFSDSVSLVQDFTADKEAVIRAIDGLTALGNTALYQAAADAAARAAAAPSPRRVIILLSDGVDYGGMSRVTRDDSIAAVSAAGVPTYTIGLGTEIDREYLTAVAQASRARFLETPTAEGLSQLYSEIGNVLRSQYVLRLTSPVSDRSKPLSLELSVVVNGASVSTTATLTAVETPPPAPPSVSLSGLAEGDEIDSAISVAAVVDTEGELESLVFLVDGAVVVEKTSPPYELSLDPASLVAGGHVLAVEARAAGGVSRAEVAFSVVAPPSGGGQPVLLLAAAGVLLVLGIAGGFVFRRRHLRRIPKRAVEVRLRPWSTASHGASFGDWTQLDEPEPEPEAETKEERLGRIVVVSGGQQQEYLIGSRPVSIGSAPWCTIVLPEDDGRIGPEEARAWLHQSRKLIFHKLTRLSVIASEGTSGGWLVLEDGDEVTLGSHRLIFTLVVPQTEEERATDAAIGEALRGFGASCSDISTMRESA
ncbi:MAG: VWA domain-containing protein [Dehalococcoidia bacterium]|nr:VWA domain-containing protein [Dehalococcoidia bacterium]